jgi:hypothetical protein
MGMFGAVFRVGNLFRKFGEETLEIPSSLWPVRPGRKSYELP